MTLLMAATQWPSNAHLIEDCHRLGYLRDDWLTLDPTYGKGTWWRRYRPTRLLCHDQALDGTDFRSLYYRDEAFDAIAFDPPYVSKGGKETSGIKGMDALYGIGENTDKTTPAEIQKLMDDGLTEMYRMLKPGGICLYKGKNYISSGSYWPGIFKMKAHADKLGFELIDMAIMVTGPPPEPETRAGKPAGPQKHFRNNYSVLLVLQKPKRKKMK